MKKCPQCGREYDLSLSYCLDDGAELLYGPAPADEPPTAILPAAPLAGEAATAVLQTQRKDAVKNSIAVLPFVHMSADEDNEYFCDGLAEEILNALTKIEGLKVAARTSAFSFKDKNTDISEIGKRLGVKTILEGSVRKSGDRLRITSQLVNAADGYHLWSERYEREMKDIFDVQDEIALAVVDALKLKLLGEERSAVLKHRTQSPEAYEFYLRGLSHFNKWTPVDFLKAIENVERAIAIDPGYASAYAGMADAYTELAFFSFSLSSMDVAAKAREAANKALQMDDSLAEAHNSAALIKMYFDWDYQGAEEEFKHALQLNPGSASVHMWYGWFLALMSRFDESVIELQRARELDPLAAPNINAFGVVSHWARQPERAIAQFHEVLELYPNYPVTLSFLAEAYEQMGDLASAIATIEQIPAAAWDPQSLSVMGYLYARSGDRERAMQVLNEFAERSDGKSAPALNCAYVYTGLGDHDEAFACLDRAFDESSAWIAFLKVDVKFDPLRSDPRFDELLRRAGFVE